MGNFLKILSVYSNASEPSNVMLNLFQLMGSEQADPETSSG